MTPNMHRLTAIVTALAGAVALPLAAQTAQNPQVQSEPAAPAADAMTLVRDADSGKLRAPTAAEAHELRNSRRYAAEARADHGGRAERTAIEPRAHRSGARGARMTDESLHQSMIVRNADGSTTLQCFDPKEGMHAAHIGEAFASRPANAPQSAAKLETE